MKKSSLLDAKGGIRVHRRISHQEEEFCERNLQGVERRG